MATLVLGVTGGVIGAAAAGPAGAATGWAIGSAIGAAAGSVIDSFLMPALFPTRVTSVSGQTVEVQYQTGAEGAPMRCAYGPLNRLAGTVIWRSDRITEVATTTSGGGKGSPKVTNQSYNYFYHVAIHLADAEGITYKRIRKIWANGRLIYSDGPTGKYTAVRFYDGTQTTADPLIAAAKAAKGQVAQAFIKSAYLVIEKLAVNDTGAQVPNINVLLEQTADCSVALTISTIMQRAGFAPGDFDVSSLPHCMHGYVVSGPTTTIDALAPLMVAYGISARERNGVIQFFPRGSEVIVPVAVADMGTYEGDRRTTDRPFKLTEPTSLSQPRQIDLKYIGDDVDLQPAATRQVRVVQSSPDATTVDLPLTMTQTEARKIARRLLYSTDAESTAFEFALPPKYAHLQEGDVATWTYANVVYYGLVTEINRGANALLIVSGRLYQQHVYTQLGMAQPLTSTGGSVYTPPATTGVILDIPALVNEQLDKVGLTVGMAASSSAATWKGGAIYRASTSGGTYGLVGNLPLEMGIGTVLTELPPAEEYGWDDSNTLDVTFLHGVPVTASEQDVMDGANFAAIQTMEGWEIIAFTTVTSLGGNRYRLSHLLRGRRGTAAMAQSPIPAGATLALLSRDGAAGFVELGSTLLGAVGYYKFPAIEGSLSAYSAQSAACLGGSMRPLAPLDFVVTPDSGDYILSWTRRSKLFGGLFAGNGLAPDESPETYIIDVYNAPQPTDDKLVRSIAVNATTYTYTAAMKTADVGSNPACFRLSQYSQVVGRGWPVVKTTA